ncbi:MAG: class I SAM-dependent methyltransferase [Myxococcaceae bacterium]
MSAHKAHRHGHHDHHGNPEDLQAYLARLEDPSRDEWQKPDEVVAALGLRAGQTVAELGAGPGYFSLRLSAAVGEAGHVFAVEVEPQIITVLRERVAASGRRNVSPVLGLPEDPLLPRAGCDVVLAVNAFHHFPDPTAYLRRVARALRPGGRLANIDFHDRETPVGPPLEQRVAREDFLAHAAAAGLDVVAEPAFLPHQYFVVLRARA